MSDHIEMFRFVLLTIGQLSGKVVFTLVGFFAFQMVSKVKKIAKNAQKKRNRQAKKGEGDRVIVNMKPKHLYVGKRGIGKTTRR